MDYPADNILNTSDGEWYYVDNTQPCHLTEVKFVFRDGKVDSWTRFVPVLSMLGGPQSREAPASGAPAKVAEQELVTRIRASRLRMSPIKDLVNWLGCSVGIVTDPS